MRMNTQNQNPNPPAATPPPPPPSEPGSWREQRRAERMAEREARRQKYGRHRFGWLWGVVLIILGVAFLFQNLGLTLATNWWGVFILIPAFLSFVAAWERYQDANRVTRGAAASFVGGLLLTVLTFIVLFNIDFGLLWPVLLIVGGLAILLTALIPA